MTPQHIAATEERLAAMAAEISDVGAADSPAPSR